jgi:hypothetical protein
MKPVRVNRATFRSGVIVVATMMLFGLSSPSTSHARRVVRRCSFDSSAVVAGSWDAAYEYSLAGGSRLGLTQVRSQTAGRYCFDVGRHNVGCHANRVHR